MENLSLWSSDDGSEELKGNCFESQNESDAGAFQDLLQWSAAQDSINCSQGSQILSKGSQGSKSRSKQIGRQPLLLVQLSRIDQDDVRTQVRKKDRHYDVFVEPGGAFRVRPGMGAKQRLPELRKVPKELPAMTLPANDSFSSTMMPESSFPSPAKNETLEDHSNSMLAEASHEPLRAPDLLDLEWAAASYHSAEAYDSYMPGDITIKGPRDQAVSPSLSGVSTRPGTSNCGTNADGRFSQLSGRGSSAGQAATIRASSSRGPRTPTAEALWPKPEATAVSMEAPRLVTKPPQMNKGLPAYVLKVQAGKGTESETCKGTAQTHSECPPSFSRQQSADPSISSATSSKELTLDSLKGVRRASCMAHKNRRSSTASRGSVINISLRRASWSGDGVKSMRRTSMQTNLRRGSVLPMPSGKDQGKKIGKTRSSLISIEDTFELDHSGIQSKSNAMLHHVRMQLKDMGHTMVASMTKSFSRDVWDACSIPHPEVERAMEHAMVEAAKARAAEQASASVRGLLPGKSSGVEDQAGESEEVPEAAQEERHHFRDRCLIVPPEVTKEDERELQEEKALAWLARQTNWCVLDVEEVREKFQVHAPDGKVKVFGKGFEKLTKAIWPTATPEEVRMLNQQIVGVQRRSVCARRRFRNEDTTSRQNQGPAPTDKTEIRFSEFYLALVKWLSMMTAKSAVEEAQRREEKCGPSLVRYDQPKDVAHPPKRRLSGFGVGSGITIGSEADYSQQIAELKEIQIETGGVLDNPEQGGKKRASLQSLPSHESSSSSPSESDSDGSEVFDGNVSLSSGTRSKINRSPSPPSYSETTHKQETQIPSLPGTPLSQNVTPPASPKPISKWGLIRSKVFKSPAASPESGPSKGPVRVATHEREVLQRCLDGESDDEAKEEKAE
eukprot:TRINITY_DN81418_c0_g1_i1.p1 TRINITY_DN81418_c0_g1~~TRINITY_DN81418_c0_g1_i1.p1  ORF type:complete len:900 (-),score=145.41 TRINITY_DN81418_c0_g1_i1:113-2812(-)